MIEKESLKFKELKQVPKESSNFFAACSRLRRGQPNFFYFETGRLGQAWTKSDDPIARQCLVLPYPSVVSLKYLYM